MAMDDCEAKEQSTNGGRSTSGLLRYPLRSAKKEKQSVEDYSNPSSVSASKRGKSALSSVSKSTNDLHVAGESKEKSAKPPRRFSGPSNSNASASTITPISEARSNRSKNPLLDVITKSSAQKKFSILSSASYWLSQIKLSESAAKHNLSLGFFKLAHDAGCETLQRMEEELRSYVQRYDLSESGDLVKDLLECYKNSGNEQSQVSPPCSEVPNELDHSSENDVNRSFSATMDVENPKPKPFEENACETHQGKSGNDADESEKKVSRRSSCKKASSSKTGSDLKGSSIPKKSGDLEKQESAQGKGKTKKPKKKSSHGEATLKPPTEETLQEDKKDKASTEMKGIIMALEL